MKKLLSILAIVTLLTGTAFADNKVENENTKKAPTTTIKGIVLDMKSGETLAGVKVVIAELNMEVYTDLDGNFEFENVVKDIYHLESEMISYEKKKLKVNANTTDNIKIVMANK